MSENPGSINIGVMENSPAVPPLLQAAGLTAHRAFKHDKTLSGISEASKGVIETAFTNVYVGLNLATIGIIVFAAMAILGIVLAFFAPSRGR